MKELGDLLELEPSEGEAAGVSSRDQPALPGDVENFDAEGTAFWPCLLLGLVFCVGLSCVLACVGFGSLRDRKSWPNHSVIVREGLCRVLLIFL